MDLTLLFKQRILFQILTSRHSVTLEYRNMDKTVYILLGLFYGTVIFGVLATAAYLAYCAIRDKVLHVRKMRKRRHLKLIKGEKREFPTSYSNKR